MDNQNLTTVFKCFLKSGLDFTRNDTNAVGQTFMGELRKHNPKFKPTKIEQREFSKYFTVNAFPVEFEPLIMACIEDHRKANNLQPRTRNSGFGQPNRRFQGGNQGRRNYQSGGNRYGNQSQGNRPYGNRPSGNKPYGNRPQGGENRSNNERPYGNRSYGDKPYDNRSQGDKPYGNRPQGGENRPYNDRPYGDRPYGGDKPYGNRPYGDKPPYGNRNQDSAHGHNPNRDDQFNSDPDKPKRRRIQRQKPDESDQKGND